MLVGIAYGVPGGVGGDRQRRGVGVDFDLGADDHAVAGVLARGVGAVALQVERAGLRGVHDRQAERRATDSPTVQAPEPL